MKTIQTAGDHMVAILNNALPPFTVAPILPAASEWEPFADVPAVEDTFGYTMLDEWDQDMVSGSIRPSRMTFMEREACMYADSLMLDAYPRLRRDMTDTLRNA